MRSTDISKLLFVFWSVAFTLLILGKFWFGDLFSTVLIASFYLLPFILFILFVSKFFIFKNKETNLLPVFFLYLISTILIYYFAYITPFELHVG